MNALGRLLRERYVLREGLLPEEFDQQIVNVRSSSRLFGRPLMSTEAVLQTLFPGAASVCCDCFTLLVLLSLSLLSFQMRRFQ